MFKTINKPMIMGILNITPDSFSDGGQYISPELAFNQVQKMLSEGADIIDIGGESTRPGSQRVAADEQINRVIPIIELIRKKLSTTVLVSVDTTLSVVAEAALKAGANIINDISAGADDESILYLAAQYKHPIILMHKQGSPETMQDNPFYQDVVTEVCESLQASIHRALAIGVRQQDIIIDPGIGFGKRGKDNLKLLADIKKIVNLDYPVLLGTSRKRFMGRLCTVNHPSELVAATAATTALGIMAGVQIFRVHDVKENRQAADVTWAIKNNFSLPG